MGHYNTLEVGEMVEEFGEYGVKWEGEGEGNGKLLDPFPMESMMEEGKKKEEEVREVHYNFFGEERGEFGEDIGMLGMP